jgi:hypothetical protein
MEDDNNGAQQQGDAQGQRQGTEPQKQGDARHGDQGGGKTYTDADVDAIIAKKFAKWQEQQEAKVSEAAKLAEMNATQKAEYERDKLKKQLAEYERREQVSQMVSESRGQLSERGINVPDALVRQLIGESAEDTKRAVESFADAFNAAVESAVKERLAGKPPANGAAGKPMTKADIMSIKDTAERQRAIREHMELFTNQ